MGTVVKPWSVADCDSCGCEYQVTRTSEKVLEEFICSDCETYDRAYKEGYSAGVSSVKPRCRILTGDR